MNPIQSKQRIDFYNDLTRSARFTFNEYNMAVNDAIIQFIDEKLGDEENRNPESFQWIQSVRSDLQTLIKVGTPAITNGTVITNRYYSITPSHIVQPTDYYDFVCLFVTIDGYTDYSKPTSYDLIGPQFKNSFTVPTNIQTYFNEDGTGLFIYRGVGGTFSAASLTYIKTPNTFSIGQESNLINPGGTVLTNGLSYIATEDSVQNSISYIAGTQFTAVGTALTSGQVVLNSVTVPIDLPTRVHDDICKKASVIMLKNISMFDNAQAIQSEVSKV